MKATKKILALLLAVILLFSFAACSAQDDGDNSDASNVKIGVILLHDESIGYDKAHMDGINAGAEANGIDASQIIWKKSIPEDSACADAARDLAAQGCNLIISDSYGHQEYMQEVAAEYPDITFVSMTGDLAASSGLPNYKNAFTAVYQSRYVSGVVAGMKLKELVDTGVLTADKMPNSFDADGNIRIGYVGAFPYAEVVSGYTAFYLGAKSVVENLVMEVEYTSSWADETKEAAAAQKLVSDGCVIIGQHADTTGAPAAIEKLNQAGTVCYSVGYNISMLGAAPTAALTSASNNWGVYYTYAFKCLVNNEDIAVNWTKGYADDAVKITDLGESCAEGTQEKVNEVIAALKDGSLNVFDTAVFTVGGETISEYMANVIPDANFEPDTNVIQDGIFRESDAEQFRSAPYFDIRIDGITENAIAEG